MKYHKIKIHASSSLLTERLTRFPAFRILVKPNPIRAVRREKNNLRFEVKPTIIITFNDNDIDSVAHFCSPKLSVAHRISAMFVMSHVFHSFHNGTVTQERRRELGVFVCYFEYQCCFVSKISWGKSTILLKNMRTLEKNCH